MQFSGVVAPGQSKCCLVYTMTIKILYFNSCFHTSTAASVSVPIEAKQYMRQLVEQCMMQFFVAVKARESAQLFLKVHTLLHMLVCDVSISVLPHDI